MANMSTTDASPALPPNGRLSHGREMPGLAIPSSGERPPQSSSSDSGGEDDPLFVDPDDAQSMIQPALSPVVTRLTSPKTPAAEKAAAMDRLPGGGLFSMLEGDSPPEDDDTATTPKGLADSDSGATAADLAKARSRHNRGFSVGQMPSQPIEMEKRPTPWQAGPRTHVIENEPSSKPFRYGGFGQSPQRRSTTTGAEAFRRIRGAFPSITLPTNFFSNISSPSFLSGASPKQPSPEKRVVASTDGNAESRSATTADKSKADNENSVRAEDRITSAPLVKSPSGLGTKSRPTSAMSGRPRPIRRSTSHDSMPYLSLSRVSSYGDDDRWGHVREQTNSRLKAIKDSWDRPTFKMPQLPNMIPAPLKRNTIFGVEGSSPVPSPSIPSPGYGSLDSKFPELDRALESLTGDIVIMGGYRGSVLRSTKTNRQVWVPVKVGLNIRKVNLEVGLDPEDEERMEETIYPSGMLQNIGPVDISKRLFKRLRESENAKNGKLRVWDFGWDWRLSPRLLSGKLLKFLENLPCNQDGYSEGKGATVIAHSLGGLITRHAVNQRPEFFAGVIYAGTPQRCINILGPLRNGDAVLLNEKVLTAHVNFTLRTSFVFLPEDGFCFVNKHTGEEYPIDFYDPQSWAQYALCPSIEPPLPAYNARQSPFGSFLSLSASLPAMPGRSRGNSGASDPRGPQARNNQVTDAAKNEVTQDRTLAPQMGSGQADSVKSGQQNRNYADAESRDRNMEYLTRTLKDTKQFRAELAHKPELAETNSYPPFAVMYGKDIPTVYASHVTCRDAIASTDCYDELMFRSGDGVVLSREAMLPPGYDLVKGGRISTDRGHITILGDLNAVGQALEAIMRGRKKGIGLGLSAQEGKKSVSSA